MILSKALSKTIMSLPTAKGRRRSGLFMAEGSKTIFDTLEGFKLYALIATIDWINDNKSKLSTIPEDKIIESSVADIARLSCLQTPRGAIAIYEIPEATNYDRIETDDLVIALDDVRDPGNLGTIIRLADWFGIKHIVASKESADCFNPKVVQATMGSLARVQISYMEDLSEWLSKQNVPVYGTFLNGNNIYESKLSKGGIIVMGNEGEGISDEVADMVTKRLTIPSFSVADTHAESLNVATATAIVLSEFRRVNS